MNDLEKAIETEIVEQAKRHNIDVMETMLNTARELRHRVKQQIDRMHVELGEMDQTIVKLEEELAKMRAE